MNILENCSLCPRMCGVNRIKGEKGFCGSDNRIKIARSALHYWEEPCISGESGSGTVFFSHCTIRCVYCQNHSISTSAKGKYISEQELSEEFLKLQSLGANNINLVTPTHYVPQITEAVKRAKASGLTLPILYNTGGYENVETIKMLDGIVDIFLPDLKYFNDKYAIKYSDAPNYFKIASDAIAQMYRQVGKCTFDENGIIKKGVVVRHLMLPGLLFDSKKIFDYLYNTYGDNIFISIMSQYTPVSTLPKEYPELNKSVNRRLYDALLDYAAGIGITNAYVQDEGVDSESFIPEFFGDD